MELKVDLNRRDYDKCGADIQTKIDWVKYYSKPFYLVRVKGGKKISLEFNISNSILVSNNSKPVFF